MANFVDNNKVKSGSGFSRRLDTDLDLFFFSKVVSGYG